MDFEFNDEQKMLQEVSRDLLRAKSAPEAVRSVRDAGEDFSASLWELGAGLGWTGLAVSENRGGSGQGLVELVIAAVELGRHVTPGPFIDTAVIAHVLDTHASEQIDADIIEQLAEGTLKAALALEERATALAISDIASTVSAGAGGLVLNGEKTAVAAADSVDWLLVSALHEGSPVLVLAPSTGAGVTLRQQTTLDETRTFYDVAFSEVQIPDAHLVGDATTVQWTFDAAATMAAADSLGIGERLLEMTVDYAKVREQFDRPIGSFQAVKHKLADMLIGINGTFAATYAAAMRLDAQSPEATKTATVAKAFASERISDAAGEALQIHGGIGFTWEHDLHLYLRRAKINEARFGNAIDHQRRLTALLA